MSVPRGQSLSIPEFFQMSTSRPNLLLMSSYIPLQAPPTVLTMHCMCYPCPPTLWMSLLCCHTLFMSTLCPPLMSCQCSHSCFFPVHLLSLFCLCYVPFLSFCNIFSHPESPRQCSALSNDKKFLMDMLYSKTSAAAAPTSPTCSSADPGDEEGKGSTLL